MDPGGRKIQFAAGTDFGNRGNNIHCASIARKSIVRIKRSYRVDIQRIIQPIHGYYRRQWGAGPSWVRTPPPNQQFSFLINVLILRSGEDYGKTAFPL
jgi:hypothetical protein